VRELLSFGQRHDKPNQSRGIVSREINAQFAAIGRAGRPGPPGSNDSGRPGGPTLPVFDPLGLV
jgi:hypothetical protein